MIMFMIFCNGIVMLEKVRFGKIKGNKIISKSLIYIFQYVLPNHHLFFSYNLKYLAFATFLAILVMGIICHMMLCLLASARDKLWSCYHKTAYTISEFDDEVNPLQVITKVCIIKIYISYERYY